MKKIGIYLQSGPACGGTYQYNRLIVDALSQLPKSEFDIVAIYDGEHWREILSKENIAAKCIHVRRFWHLAAGLWRRSRMPLSWWHKFARHFHPLAKAMLKEKCDLWLFPSQDAYAYLMPVNSVATVHDLMHRYERRFPEVGNDNEYKIREFHYQQTCLWAKQILVDSTLGKNQLMESFGVLADKCQVLPYIAQKDIENIFSKTFDNKYKLPKKYLFYPAQFWEHKNHANLIQAIALCRQDLEDIQLVLVGSKKNAYDKVVSLIEELNLKEKVHIFGLVDEQDIPEFYRRARALVMPTFFGPTNIPPLEAFALDCPVVISGIYAMKEQLGDAALYFSPDSIADIADKIRKIWLDDALCEDLRAKGSMRKQLFSFDQFAINFNKVIQCAIATT